MRLLRLERANLPKIAVLATGLAAAVLMITVHPSPAEARPTEAQDCTGCHAAGGSTTAAPSTVNPDGGATYTVAITLAANPSSGNSGYAIVPVTTGSGTTNGGNTSAALSYSATMTAPAAAGAYTYDVFTNQGSTDPAGQASSASYTITVAPGGTTPPVTATTPPATTPPATTPPTIPPTIPPPAATPPVVTSSDIHGPYSPTSQQCGICHRVHTSRAPGLLPAASQSAMCLSCHDGTGASPTAQAQYSLVRPANNPATREFYSHDATTPSAHTSSGQDEFGGVSNRHSECSDCHNPHKAKGTDTTQTTTGWEPSGRLTGVSGVSVVNGAAGAAPTYSFLDGIEQTPTREYQLCFKCHSGSTTLTPNAGLKPSQYALDKGVEFNPSNPSFHPVEAAGTNQTTKMADSLAGTSPYKLWNFTPDSTIRCLNCHASSSTPAAGTTPATAAGEALAPHTSTNRGILLRNYQDRVLKSTGAAYSAGDFALCYVCHAEEPFVNETTNATNFSLHGKHVSGLANQGSGNTEIDTPGAGQGNAICAECHFRLHSTTNKVGTQEVPGSRLVNFAPNVQPVGGTIVWTPTAEGSGSCTLTCHGYTHNDRRY